jgi:hypothetical protein
MDNSRAKTIAILIRFSRKVSSRWQHIDGFESGHVTALDAMDCHVEDFEGARRISSYGWSMTAALGDER